jgi:RecA-family ATPase
VEDLLPSHGINMLYGPTGTGKSFVALDLAICVGSGRDWLGHKVDQKPVLYFAGEGHSAEFHNRIRAACGHYGIAKGAPDLFADLVFRRFDIFGSSEDRQLMDDHIERITELYRSPPGLIIIDTFAACTPGMDEISGRDVSRVLSHLNRMAERSTAAILVIHHTGAAGTRERGHTSLAGDCVSIMRVDRDQLTVLKQREGSSGYTLGLALKIVPLEDGITTCIVAQKSPEATASPGLRGKPGRAFGALVGVLNDGAQADFADWRRACEHAGLTPRSAVRSNAPKIIW